MDGAELPAWLNEGLAGYYEYEVGIKGDRPDASYARMIRSVDQAKSAAAEGMLFRLSQVESQREWNGRAAELASLQYAQSHMAVRYLSETYGETVPIRIVTQVGSGASLADAIASVTGAAYAEMEADFIEWLKNWDDPDRAAACEYVQTLRVLADESEEILRLRGEANKEWSLHFDRVKFEKSAIEFRDRSKELVDRANLLRPHESVADLHTAATEFFLVFNEWMTKQAQFASTNSESSRLAGNALIPEFGYRYRDFRNRLYGAELILNLNN